MKLANVKIKVGGLKFSMAQKKFAKSASWWKCQLGEVLVGGSASLRKCQLKDVPVGGLVPVGGQKFIRTG